MTFDYQKAVADYAKTKGKTKGKKGEEYFYITPLTDEQSFMHRLVQSVAANSGYGYNQLNYTTEAMANIKKYGIPLCGHCDEPNAHRGIITPTDSYCPGAIQTDLGSYASDDLKKWGIDHTIPLGHHVRRFYGVIAAAMLKPSPENNAYRDKVVNEIADQLLRGLTMACLGEARYDGLLGFRALGNEIYRRTKKVPNLDKLYAKLETNVLMLGTARSSHSRNSAVSKPPVVINEDYLRNIRNVFLWAGRWQRGQTAHFGGLMWAHCADVGLAYVAGRISTIEFVDNVIDAWHNGSPVLTKTMRHGDNTAIMAYLGQKNDRDPEWHVRFLPNTDRLRMGFEETYPLPVTMALVQKNIILADDVETLHKQLLDEKYDATPVKNIFGYDPKGVAKQRTSMTARYKIRVLGMRCNCSHHDMNNGYNVHDCATVCQQGVCECYTELVSDKGCARCYSAYREENGHLRDHTVHVNCTDLEESDEDNDDEGSYCEECGDLADYYEVSDAYYCYTHKPECTVCGDTATHWGDNDEKYCYTHYLKHEAEAQEDEEEDEEEDDVTLPPMPKSSPFGEITIVWDTGSKKKKPMSQPAPILPHEQVDAMAQSIISQHGAKEITGGTR